MKILLSVIVTILFVSFSVFAARTSTQKTNKKTVEAFYELAFNKHKPIEAMKLYVGDKYIQHNPFAGDGKQPFIDFFKDYYSKNPNAFVSIKRLIAEGDLVVVHVHSQQNKDDRGSAVVDIFRMEKGKIVEHWDVMQQIPDKSANDNTMF